jgi:Lactonase, 7-bladed beta-propeller/Bacterial Ig-like domain (group 2)
LQTGGGESTLSGRARSEIGNRGSSFSRAEANTGVNSSGKIKRVARVLPLLSILGLSSCLGSTVSNLFVTSVKLTPANPSIAATETQAFILNVTFADGTTDHENPNDTTWTSDNTAVATIAKTGIATAIAPGTANIGGSFQGNNAHTVLTVTNLTKAAVAAAGDSRTLHVTNPATGQEMTFAANPLNDSITVSSGGDSENVAAAEVSVLPEHGPAWLAIAPSGNFLYVVNHTSESVSVFAIDWKTGALNAVVGSPVRAGAKPWSVEVDPDGAGLSVAHLEDTDISRFRIDPATGALTPEQQ